MSLGCSVERRFIILRDCAVQRWNFVSGAFSALLSLFLMTPSHLNELLQTRFRSYLILVLFRIVDWSIQRAQQSRTRKGKRALNLEH